MADRIQLGDKVKVNDVNEELNGKLVKINAIINKGKYIDSCNDFKCHVFEVGYDGKLYTVFGISLEHTIYHLRFWGGAEENIKLELGIEKGDYWFPSKEKRKQFQDMLIKYRKYGLVIDINDGEWTKYKKTVHIKATYKGEEYTLDIDEGYGTRPENLEFLYTMGNFSCECNLSLFLQDKYPEFPSLDCHDPDFKLVSVEISEEKEEVIMT